VKEARLQSLVPTNRNWIQRLYKSDEVAHHTDVQRMVLAIMYLCSRFSGYWVKEYALTWGDLRLHELEIEKSAEAIVPISNELPQKRIKVEDSQDWEGLNVL